MDWLPIILYVIIGLALLTALRLPRRSLHLAGVLALAWPLGIMATTLAIMTVALITGRFYFWLFWIIVLVSAAYLIWKRRELRELLLTEVVPSYEVMPISRTSGAFYWIACGLLFSAMLASIYWVMSLGLSFPLTMSDALTNFAHKALLWFETNELKPELLRDPEYLMYKRRYPAAIPLTEAIWSYIYGDWDGTRLKYIFIMTWLAIGGLIFSLLFRRTGLLAGLLGAAFWMTLPFHLTHPWGGPIDGFADQAYALAILTGVVLATFYERDRGWAFVVLSGLAAASGMLVKQEGLIAWGLLFLFYVWRRARFSHLAIIAGVMVYVLALNKLTTQGLPDHFEGDLALNIPLSVLLERVFQLPVLLWGKITFTDYWGVMIWAVFALFLIFRISRHPWRHLLSLELFVFFAIAGIYLAVMLFTARTFTSNFDWSFQRLFIHILPLLCVITFSDFRLASVVLSERESVPSIETGISAAIPLSRPLTLGDIFNFSRRCTLFTIVATVLLIMIMVQTRENRSLAQDKHEEIEERQNDIIYSPIALLAKQWKIYGEAVDLMKEDGSEKFWFHGERHFYPSKLLNLHLYPNHGIYLSVETQMQITHFFQFGKDTRIRDFPPTKYDRIMHVTPHHVEIVNESQIGMDE